MKTLGKREKAGTDINWQKQETGKKDNDMNETAKIMKKSGNWEHKNWVGTSKESDD